MSKTGNAPKKDVPVTVGEAAAILQSAVSYCKDAGLTVRYAMLKDDTGRDQLMLSIKGLVGTRDNGVLVIEPAINGSSPEEPPSPTAINGSIAVQPEKQAEQTPASE